jgi:dihydrofolate reductase
MGFSIITAFDSNQGIGKHDTLPWKIKGDMKWFKEKTLNKVIVMGYNTWISIPNAPLKNRINIVLTNDSKKKRQLDVDGILSFNSLETLIDFCNVYYKDQEIMIIGGNTIYNQFKDIIDTMYLTKIYGDFDCDVHFPKFPFKKWELVYKSETFVENGIEYHFEQLKKQ